MAREFWAEVHDLRIPAAELREERKPRQARARVRKVLVRRAARRTLQ